MATNHYVCVSLCVIGFLFTFMTTVNSQYRNDYTYNMQVQGWLKMHVLPENFRNAFRKCQAEGAVLASPLNMHLKNAMMALQKTTLCDNCALYTGFHSAVSKGSFASIEGKLLSSISVQWAPNEPDNYNDNEDCIVILQNGTMGDVRCSETFPFVCYKKKTVNMVLNECGTTDNGYSLDSRTGSCYKFHYIGRTWRNAYMTCMAEGGYLVVINNDIEAEVVKDLFNKYPPEKILSPHKNGASIGFHDWGEPGVWYTIHGQKLEELGFSTFDNGQPDNDKTFDNGSSCGAIFRWGLLDDIWCSGTNIAFICEKDPESLVVNDEL